VIIDAGIFGLATLGGRAVPSVGKIPGKSKGREFYYLDSNSYERNIQFVKIDQGCHYPVDHSHRSFVPPGSTYVSLTFICSLLPLEDRLIAMNGIFPPQRLRPAHDPCDPQTDSASTRRNVGAGGVKGVMHSSWPLLATS
jgi:hypothetical protein